MTGERPLVQIFVRDNNVDQALKALKKKMQREGSFREMKRHVHYEKPSEKRARQKAEAVRHLGELKKDGTLIVNDYEIYSLPVLTGTVAYPDHLNEKLAKSVKNLKLFNAYQTAHELGNAKAQSVVMLGAIIKTLGLEDFDWVTVMKQFIPERLQALNIAAYQKGLLM